MTDFTMSITNTFAPNTIIASAQMNTNIKTDIRDKFNAFAHASTGHLHDGSTSNGPAVAKVSATNSADTVIVSGTAPTASKSIAVLNGELQFHDGTAARKSIGTNRLPKGIYNGALVRSAANTIKLTSREGTALSPSNPMIVVMDDPSNIGQLVEFVVTADVSLNIDSTHFGLGGSGNVTGALLRVLLINDNGTLRVGVAYLGGRKTLLTTDTTATAASVTAPEYVYCSAAVSSATNYCMEIGYFRADFTDAGDTWAIQSGVGDVVTGESPNGLWEPFNPVYSGFSANQTTTLARCCKNGRQMRVQLLRNATGTSNSTGTNFTGPAKAAARQQGGTVFDAVNNGVSVTTTGVCNIAAGTAVIDVYRDPQFLSWTSSGAKNFSMEFEFEIGPSASFIN